MNTSSTYHELFFAAAQQVATSATCHRAACGSVIVAKGKIIGEGFNAPPGGLESQRECESNLTLSKKLKSDRTCCVHAEWNAILDALSRNASLVPGSTLYFMRVDESGRMTEAGEPYCTVCSRLALQAGVETFGLWNDGPDMILTPEYNSRSYNFHKL